MGQDIAGDLFLGFDSSTQGLKAVAIDGSLRIVASQAVNFDRDLPEFGTHGGAHRGEDGLSVTAPPAMWVKALDLALERLRDAGFAFGRVAAVSGSGQQHGSVWLKACAAEALKGLDAARPLHAQLGGIFATEASPIWMDSSTGAECRAREAALGGAQALATLTGSRAYERFTGNQIAKIRARQPEVYAATDRIALVSSFVAGLLAGRVAPIDWSDGSGMNLLDIRTRRWDAAALDCTGPDLARRLGEPVASHTDVGAVHAYYLKRFGFAAACRVIAFSGDNPCSLAGLRLQRPGDVAISLGTSDTMFATLSEPKPSADEGHIFVSPIDPAAYMAMICLRNGSLTREHVRDAVAERSWTRYAELMAHSPVGNGGRIGFYLKEPEITPTILKTGIFRFDASDRPAEAFEAPAEARAVLEAQFLSMRLHGGRIGIRPRTILATGGASVDPTVIRVMCDVFGAPVFVGDVPDSAAVGAAYRALHGWECRKQGVFVPFAELMAAAPAFRRAAEPDAAVHAVYSAMLPRYEALERRILG
jgi:xylulokinase